MGLKQIEQDILNAEQTIVHGVGHLFSKQHVDEALNIATKVTSIVTWVLPYVQEISSFVPGSPVSPAMVQAAELMNTKLETVLAQASSAQKSGTLVQLAGKAGLAAMEAALAKGEIDIAGQKIMIPEDLSKIPQSQLDQAVQSAYTFYVAPYLTKVLDQPQTPKS